MIEGKLPCHGQRLTFKDSQHGMIVKRVCGRCRNEYHVSISRDGVTYQLWKEGVK